MSENPDTNKQSEKPAQSPATQEKPRPTLVEPSNKVERASRPTEGTLIVLSQGGAKKKDK